MTRKLLVTIALGAALAIAAAGSATSIEIGAGDIQLDTGQTGITGQTDVTGQTGALPQCADLSDNDGDGLVDLSDPGCSGAVDSSEYNAPISSGGSDGSGGSGGSSGSGGSDSSVGSGITKGNSGGSRGTTTGGGK